MEKKVFLNYEGLLQFSNALELLNASINEFNKVADKMVPEKLLQEGFLGYLHEFCKTLEENSGVRLVMKSKMMELELEEAVEIILFRVMRSVLITLLKNSQPLFIFIDLAKSNGYLKILIEDDGANIFKQQLFFVSQAMDTVTTLLESLGGKLIKDITSIAGNKIEIEVQL